MELLKTITDTDLSPGVPNPSAYSERKATRVIITNQTKIALINVANKHYHKLPGGGLNDDEVLTDGLKREVVEEIGCQIDEIKELGIVDEYRNKLETHQVSYCFTAKVKGEIGTPALEPEELNDGFVTEWLDLDQAIAIMEKEKEIDDYVGKFIRERDLFLLKHYKQTR